MQIRIKDKKVVKAVTRDAKARGSSKTHAVTVALEVHYDRKKRTV